MLASDASYDDDFNNDIYNSMVQYSAVSNVIQLTDKGLIIIALARPLLFAFIDRCNSIARDYSLLHIMIS